MNSKSTFTFEQDLTHDHDNETRHNRHRSLRRCVESAMEDYFVDLDGQHATDLYQMVLQEVEAPLLAAVMKYARYNQSKASEMLSMNRGTLRKKLKQYDLL